MLILSKCEVCGNDRMHVNEFNKKFYVVCADCLTSTKKKYNTWDDAIKG